MKIIKVTQNKKEYIDLLLLADEQEDMIDKYLDRGEMFVLFDDTAIAECVVTKEAEGIYEIKNIAVRPSFTLRGYGKTLIEYVFSYYVDCKVMYVGTGDTPSMQSFYGSCGFVPSHRIKNFFIDNYEHEMIEDGVKLTDMIYLKRTK